MTNLSGLARATEALIVGGGPAGLAAGIALRRKGIDCLIIEALPPGIDKACGEGLMPDALHSLDALGIAMTASDGRPFRGIRFQNATHHVEASFPAGAGIGVRRTQLHARLIEGARDAGVPVLWNTRIKLRDRNHGEVLGTGEKLHFRWLIGADGQASAVRRWSGLGASRKESLRFGFRRHYQVKPWSDFVEVHWAAGCQMYVTPVAEDCVCIVIVSRNSQVPGNDILAAFPEITCRLDGAPVVSQHRGGVSATRKLRRVTDHTVALIGDASGSVDAVTGEGLALSFRQALALANAIASGSLESYQGEHRRIGKLPHAMGSLMLTMDRWPALEIRVMRALSSRPELFSELLSAHVGAASLAGFALRRGPQLGWGLLTAGARAKSAEKSLRRS